MARPRKFEEPTVVAAATELFWRKGYKATTPRDLVEVTGLSKSSLYNTFGSKEGLFVRAMEHYIARREALLEDHMQGDDLYPSLMGWFTRCIDESTGPDGRACLICTTTLSTTDDDLLAQLSAHQGQTRLLAILRGRIRRGQLEGELGRERSADALARVVFAHTMGIPVLARGGMSAEDLVASSRLVVEAVVA